jgi:hypothetical protein
MELTMLLRAVSVRSLKNEPELKIEMTLTAGEVER